MTKVKDIMTTKVIVAESKKTVLDASKLMAQKDVSCVVVSVDDSIIGIVTERDIVRKIVAERFDPNKVLLENIMTTPLVTVSQDATVEEASRLMVTYGIRRLPVVDDGRLEGIITATDIAKHAAKEKNYEDTRLNAIARLPTDELPPSYG